MSWFFVPSCEPKCLKIVIVKDKKGKKGKRMGKCKPKGKK